MTNESSSVAANIGLPPGSKIGKYDVVEQLGIGGQAIVYKGYDAMLDRHVAIKQISSHLAADPKFMERFRREAQILAKLGGEQSAVVTIHELLEDTRGLFIVMEYVPGILLERTLADNPGPVEQKAVLQIIWRLAAGLHAVHTAGIIHRDIKPGNIIIAEGLRPKIADFGVAASITGQTSMLLGTTKYMAPELLSGGVVDGRADMYSLGFIAYEMLLGRQKFNEIFTDVVRDKHSEALRWMKWHGNPGVEAPALSQVNPAIAPALSDIVARMIAKNPAERLDSMEALGRAIKTTFSPKAKAAAGAGVKRTPHAIPSEVVEAAIVADEGDELDVGQGPATAAIPKKKLATRTKVLIAAVCLLAVGVVFGVLALKKHQENQDLETRVQNGYRLADEAYANGKYEEAALKFAELVSRYRTSGLAEVAKADVMVHMAKANQAIFKESWDVASTETAEAEKVVKAVQGARKDLYRWTNDTGESIKQLVNLRINAFQWIEARNKARALLDKKDYDGARAALVGGTFVLNQAQQNELNSILGKIDRDRIKDNYDTKMRLGDESAAAGKPEDAIVRYKEAIDLAEGPDIKSFFSPVELEDMTRTPRDKMAALERGAVLDSLAKKVAEARAAGNKLEERKALVELNKRKPDPANDTRIKQIDAELKIAQAKSIMDNDPTGALPLLKEAESTFPTQEAKALINIIERRSELAARRAKADGLLAAGNWPEALSSYQDLAKDAPSQDIANAIKECKYQIQKAKAMDLERSNQPDLAMTAWEAVRTIKPEAAAEVEGAIANIRGRQNWAALVTTAKAALTGEDYASLRAILKKMKSVNAQAPEIAEFEKEIKYGENLKLGKQEYDQNNFEGALGYFKVAKTAKDTPDVRRWIKLVTDRLKGPSE